MANEKKTENIVRRHFDKFSSILVEEQKSDSSKINKLLQSASKKGDKFGRPEFIISYNNNDDFIIVVECKSDIRKHQSKSLDKYSEYSVDGVLLYASFLSKEYDVLAIAVSGETIEELKVSHFLNLKGSNSPTPIFSNKLLDVESYLDGYIESPEKYRQDYDELLSFSKDLNITLHSKKVKESQRSLLISGILIALENNAFKKSYREHNNPQDLANSLVDTIANELRNANIPTKKLDNLKNAYSFIKTHTALAGEKKVLSNLIDDIDANINNFLKTHKYIDVLGQFYIEFLRYANSDKGLGIVLTPPHITELFSGLADVNKDSIVFDNCTGTGGFLISAMSKMIEDAKGDKKKIESIKQKQLIGVEYLDDIFALACSNMYIHQDGKTNIIHGSCFDTKIISQVMEHKPTIGFLNPPYPKLPTDPLELDFVLNNLSQLEPNGICIAILPINCLCTTKGRELECKKIILQNHTLEAVLSMPNELFHNSKVGVVTAVIVLTAHKKHSANKETYFGYWKNDGFEKRKHLGRVDFYGKWEGIKSVWLESFEKRKVEEGFSLLKHVKPEDEWCAEAYMDTDYTKITKDDFLNEIKKYIVYNITKEYNENITP